MKKKLLTIDDLVQFCQKQKLYSFNAKEYGRPLCVQIPASFEKDDDNDDESLLMYATVKAFHTGRNRNHSNVTIEAAQKAMKTMAYKPILANFAMTESGELDFTSHDFTVDENGEVEYQEHQIGCFTADEPYMEQDPNDEERQYVYATCAIPKEYTAAADIIERKNGTKVSVELIINEMEFSAKDKELLFTDVEVSGLTLLGTNPETGEEVQEGMEGARLDISDFSIDKNSVCFDKAIEIMRGLKDSLDNYITAYAESTKGGNSTMEVFEENVETTEVTEDESVGAESETETEENNTEESTESETATEAESEEEANVTPEEDSETEQQDNFATLSVTVNGETKNFSCSLVEKLNALYTLVNETYGESDNEWYDVDADDEKKEVFMNGFFSGKHFKQKYSVKKDVYSLQGDRVECFVKLLTADEIKQLDALKSDYAEVSERLAKYEAEPDKMNIFSSDEWKLIAETDEFKKLSEVDNHFDLSVDEINDKLNSMLLDYSKHADFSKTETSHVSSTSIAPISMSVAKKRSRYGGLGNKDE